MAAKEIKNLALASEHQKGEYNINNNKGSGFYSYMYIVTENIGEFYLSYINKNGILDIRTDGYPWKYLMTQKNTNYHRNKKISLIKIKRILWN